LSDSTTDTPGVRWRPVPRVRPLALGLVRRDRRLLLVEVRDDAGCLKGWRPLGGGIEFGERAAEAVAREFREELAVEIAIEGTPEVYENLYEHEGARGRGHALLS
jgi:ADP-ribose pyrophosphatase YjhB (NUDIX family)